MQNSIFPITHEREQWLGEMQLFLIEYSLLVRLIYQNYHFCVFILSTGTFGFVTVGLLTNSFTCFLKIQSVKCHVNSKVQNRPWKLILDIYVFPEKTINTRLNQWWMSFRACWLAVFWRHMYICLQSTTSNHTHKLIYHHVLIVFPGRPRCPFNCTL